MMEVALTVCPPPALAEHSWGEPVAPGALGAVAAPALRCARGSALGAALPGAPRDAASACG